MYTLYYSRKEKTIKVTKARKALQNLNFTEEVTRYNDCYFICSNRKPLIEKAKDIQTAWLLELVKELETIREINL
jgi:hypothetical protein